MVIDAQSRPTARARLRASVEDTDTALGFLIAAIVVYVVVFGALVWQRHDRFGSFGFDMGIFDQAVWLAARGESFMTTRGLDLFGHHANLDLYLLAPFSWLGAGPHFLNLLQVGALGITAVPLYALGRHRGLAPFVALATPVAFLLHPATGLLAWELFHPETVAVLFVVAAYLAAARERWRWYAVLAIVAVGWKEDVALFVFVLGIILGFRGHRRVGAWTMALTATWFLFVNRVVLSAVNGEGAFYNQFYGDLGGSPFEIARTALVHPTEILSRLSAPDAVEYVWTLAAPLGLIALVAPGVALLGLPQLLGNLLSINGFTRDISYHYTALPLAALALASVEALARPRFGDRSRRALAALMVVAALAGAAQWGASPFGGRRDDGLWPAAGDPRRGTKEAAVALIPDGAAVSATYSLVPHLSRRERIYEFPNPFAERNWGVNGERTHDPDTIEWIAVDRTTMGQADRATLARALASGGYTIRLDQHQILVAHRRR